MNVSRVVTDYIADRRMAGCRPPTLNLYRLVLKRLTGFARQKSITRIDALMPEHVKAYLASRSRRGICWTTINTERRVILQLAWFATRQGLIDSSGWSKQIPKMRGDVRKIRYLKANQCSDLISMAKCMNRREELSRVRDLAVIALFLDSALRRSELVSLKLGDIDFERREIRVDATCKGRREHTAFFSKKTAKLLRAYLKIRGERDHDWFWISRYGTRLSGVRVYFALKEIAGAAGIDLTVHALRHTAATLFLNYGLSVADVQRLLDHKDIRTTIKYLHLRDDDVRKRYDKAAPLDNLDEDT